MNHAIRTPFKSHVELRQPQREDEDEILSGRYVPGGAKQTFVWGCSAPRSTESFTLLYTTIDEIGTPFIYLRIETLHPLG